MGSIWEEMANDGPEFLETFGRPITFRGDTFPALITRSFESQILSDGGQTYFDSYTVRILAPVGSIYQVNEPKWGESITLFNRQYTITEVASRPPDPWIDVKIKLTSTV